jgi:phage terminase large subunit-like protein
MASKPQKNFPEIAKQYCLDVISGKIPAGHYIKRACEKHISDLKRSDSGESRWFFDEQAASRPCKFIELMPHTKGKWARERKRLELEPWQAFFVASVFGWVDRLTGLRKHRQAVLFVPRKNGKSQLAAAIGLYMLTADGENGAEVYSGATTQKQAFEVFTPAKIMVQRTPALMEKYHLEPRAAAIIEGEFLGKFEPIIGNPGDGSSPHCALIDEYHEHDDDRQVETMMTGMGARDQPLLLVITTAGSNMAGPCYQMQIDCQGVLDGIRDDDRVFSLIYSIDKGDDWRDIKNVIKANPNYGVSVNAEYLEMQLASAISTPRKQSAFQTKHCNVWVGARDAFFNVQKWTELGDTSLKIEQFKGARAWVGLDLASKTDVACIAVYVQPEQGKPVAFVRHYLPDETVMNNDNYMSWAVDNWIIQTPGAIIDQDRIKDDLLGYAKEDGTKVDGILGLLDVQEIAVDPHMAVKITTELMDAGAPIAEMSQSMVNLSEPMKQLEADIISGGIRHNGCPVMRWMISNVTTRENYKGQVYPRKERDENKIDGVVALIMAIGRAIRNEQPLKIDSWVDDMVTITDD